MQKEADPAQDKNYLAFQKALNEGQLCNLEPGTVVAFHNGEMVASAQSLDELTQAAEAKGVPHGFFFSRIGQPEVIDIPHFDIE